MAMATVGPRSSGEGMGRPEWIEEVFGALADGVWPALTNARMAEEILGLPDMPECVRLLASRVRTYPEKLRVSMREVAEVARCAKT